MHEGTPPDVDAGLKEKVAVYLAQFRASYPARDCDDDDIVAMFRESGFLPELVSEQEVLDTLTNDGASSLEHAFVMHNLNYYWDPIQGNFLYRRLDDGSLSAACQIYLARLGRRFERWSEVLAWAEVHQWPRIEDLRENAWLKEKIAEESR